MQEPNRASTGIQIANSKATLSTSRRGFIKATAVLGSALASYVASSYAIPNDARAQSPQGCESSGGQPKGCICFLKGTFIQTPHGEVTVENLMTGDRVITLSGEASKIKWAARMSFERNASCRPEILPVVIKSGALGDGLPYNDLYVSGAHCFYLNGLLIPAINLVNGRTIQKCTRCDADSIEYFHIELEEHDVIFANGVPAETLQGNENRRNFDNFDEYVQLYGSELVALTPFAPVVGNFGGRQELRSRLRSMIAPVYDMRQPLDIIRDEIAQQAERKLAA